MDLRIWAPLSCVSQSIIGKVRLAYVFGLHGHDALLVTEDDEVLACGSNKYGCLGLGGSHPSLSLRSVVALRGKEVKGFSFGYGSAYTFMVAYTNTGNVYAWGRRIGQEDEYATTYQGNRVVQTLLPSTIDCTPTLVLFPSDSIIISEVACGTSHCLALSMEGKVYSWGFNDVGQLGNGSYQRSVVPIIIEGHLRGQCVVKISCGNNFSVVLLDSGKVYAWGVNKHGQVGLSNVLNVSLPTKIRGLNDVIIKDLVCGNAHILVVTNVGSIYGWGKNSRCELGLGDSEPRLLPEVIPTAEKFVDIAAACSCSISAAMNDKSEVFRWGDFTDFYCSTPRKTPYKSLQEVFAQFASPRIMFKPVVRQSQSKSTNVATGKKFHDKTTSDLTIVAEGKQIFVHREILTSRSDYFRVFLQEHWVGSKQRYVKYVIQGSRTTHLWRFASIIHPGQLASGYSPPIPTRLQNEKARKRMGVMFCKKKSASSLFKMIKSQRGKDKLGHNGYMYLFYKYTADGAKSLEGEIVQRPLFPRQIAGELLSLADEYQDLTFKERCEECLQFNIGIDNVANLFALALKLKATILLEKCISFAGCHISEVLLTPAVSKWDKDTLREFVMQCHKKKLFRS